MLSEKSRNYKLKQFIHVSALGIEKAIDSEYAKSKLKGEENILNNLSSSVILRPSLVYSVNDNFTTNIMTLLSLLPVFPLYYNGNTKFSPIHVSDFCEIIVKIIDESISSEIIECVGPEKLSFKEIIKKLLIAIDKKAFLLPVPTIIAKIIAFFLEKLPTPLITQDQLRLLKYDNILSKENKSNIDIGFETTLKFDEEIVKYSYMWKKGGEYSK